MGKIYVPTNSPEDWKPLLAKPEKHWRTGYSAKTLAYCWQEASGFPRSVKRAFRNSGLKLFQDIEILMAFPEYKVSLPPKGGRPSQNDIFILAKGNGQLVCVAVEGKTEEPFGDYVSDWKLEEGKGKDVRIKFLCNKLQIKESQISHVRYQLIHRTASALIQAEKFNAKNALMLVHSFCRTDEWKEGFEDYKKFLVLYGIRNVEPDSVVRTKNIEGINLYFGWVRGEEEYLDK